MTNSIKDRYTPNYKNIEAMLVVIDKDIQETVQHLKDDFGLDQNNIDIAYHNIDYLVDSFCLETGTPYTNHKAVAGIWGYLTDVYLYSLYQEFVDKFTEAEAKQLDTSETKCTVAYINRTQATEMVKSITDVYMKRIGNDGKGKGIDGIRTDKPN